MDPVLLGGRNHRCFNCPARYDPRGDPSYDLHINFPGVGGKVGGFVISESLTLKRRMAVSPDLGR